MFRDLRMGARMLWRSPGFTLTVVLALALGIGANSAMFSVVDGLLLHPVTYQDPDNLAILQERNPEGRIVSAAPANYFDWRTQAKSFSEIAAWVPVSFVLVGDRPEQLNGANVSANFFHTLGVKPALGRVFLPSEDGTENLRDLARVAVISNKLWKESLGGDPHVLGRSIQLSGINYAVVGVMPPEFRFRRITQVWVPAAFSKTNREFHNITAIGRLRGPMEGAISEMKTVSASISRENPKAAGWRADVMPLLEFIVSRDLRNRLLLLFGAVGLTLLLACSNVASLLLARSSARQKEIAIRISLGATRARLAAQLLTESLLLALLGGAAGLILAYWLIEAAPSILPASAVPAGTQILLNANVVLFALGISLATGFLFGLAPAIAAPPDVQETLKEAARGSTGGPAKQTFRRAIVAIQIAVALMLVSSAGLMIQSLQRMSNVNLGFQAKNVATWRMFLPAAKWDADRAFRMHRAAMDRVASLPGVESVAVGSYLPLSKRLMGVPFDVEGATPKSQEERPGVVYLSVTPNYFKTLSIPVKLGRAFAESDDLNNPPVAIISEGLAKRFFGSENPVGRRVVINRPRLGSNEFSDDVWAEVVGVASNVKMMDLNSEPPPMLYVPHAQNMWSDTNWFAIKASVPVAALTQAIRREMADLDRETPVESLGSLESSFDSEFAQPRFQMQLMGGFAVLALVLAVVGIYGVVAYMVTQRRQEIGLRMALGASPARVLSQTIMEGLKLTAIGVGMGLLGTFLVAGALRSVLVGVSGTDPATVAAAGGLMTAATLFACLIPAIRASRIDPAIALRP